MSANKTISYIIDLEDFFFSESEPDMSDQCWWCDNTCRRWGLWDLEFEAESRARGTELPHLKSVCAAFGSCIDRW